METAVVLIWGIWNYSLPLPTTAMATTEATATAIKTEKTAAAMVVDTEEGEREEREKMAKKMVDTLAATAKTIIGIAIGADMMTGMILGIDVMVGLVVRTAEAEAEVAPRTEMTAETLTMSDRIQLSISWNKCCSLPEMPVRQWERTTVIDPPATKDLCH